MTSPTKNPLEDKITQVPPSGSQSPEIESMTQELSTMSSTRFTFFPKSSKHKFSSLKMPKRRKSTPKLTVKCASDDNIKCSLHNIAQKDTVSDVLTDSTDTRQNSKCCVSRTPSLLSCATCGNSPDTSPDTSTVQDLTTLRTGYSRLDPPDPLLSRQDSLPKIVVVPESIRKLSDYKFPRN